MKFPSRSREAPRDRTGESLSIVICEKPSQAKQISAAVGNRYGRIMPLRGHVIRLAEPQEVNPAWETWNTDLLWTGKLFPFMPAKHRDPAETAKLQQIVDDIGRAIRNEDHVIIATDPDREGQLLGQEILEYHQYKGRVSRVHFLAVDAETISKAFREMRPNEEFIGEYEAGLARAQCDQLSNLTLTRTASQCLMAEGAGGYLSLGRVRTPVLAMVARREKEILEFKPQEYYEIDAAVEAPTGSKAVLTCNGLPKGVSGIDDAEDGPDEDQSDEAQIIGDDGDTLAGKIQRKDVAEAIANSLKGTSPVIAVKSGKKTTAPPKLFDTATITAAGSLRLGYDPDMMTKICQSLYDKEIITYPRGESSQMPESAALEAYPLLEMLTDLPRYAGHAPLLEQPVIRKGKTGTYWDGIKDKYSHFAIVPNFAACDRIPRLIQDLSEPEMRVFDMIARRFMAAHAPDYVYEQTVLSFGHPWAPPGRDPIVWKFSKTGNVPVKGGWKEIEFPDGSWKKGDKEPNLDPFSHNEKAAVTHTRVNAKMTRPPGRIRLSAIPVLMQQVWRIVPKEQAQYREKLKAIEGIGRPSTRNSVATDLVKVGQLAVDKDFVRPTAGGMRLWETLTEVAPNIVDPVRTAVWETLFTKISRREMTLAEVIDKVAKNTDAERLRIIEAGRNVSIEVGPKKKPDAKILDWARRLAAEKKIPLPKEVSESAQACSKFIDEHRPKDAEGKPLKASEQPPNDKQIALARSLADKLGLKVTAEHLATSGHLSAFIDAAMKASPPSESQLSFARKIAEEKKIDLPEDAVRSRVACSKFIDKHKSGGGKKPSGKTEPRNKRPFGRR